MSVLIVIPARGGSKGIPRKNLRLVGGIPLVGRAVRTAARALAQIGGTGNRLLCSTDDEEIARTAQEWGAEVPFLRPEDLSRDETPTIEVLLHLLDRIGQSFDTVVLLQPTSPLTAPEDVVAALAFHRETGDPIIGIARCEHPIEWTFRMDGERRLTKAIVGEAGRRQDAPAGFRPNGALYVASVATLRSVRGFVTTGIRGYVMPAERSIDIDVLADLNAAEALLAGAPVPNVIIGDREVGHKHPCFVIAEIGVNHNGDLMRAMQMVEVAARAGADAAKFQTFSPECVISPGARQAEYQRRNTGVTESQLEMVRRLELGDEAFKRLAEHCAKCEILFLSSPFDLESADLLESLGVPAFKIGSGELTNHPFLANLARRGRPLLLSTGMATLREVDEALEVIRHSGDPSVALLHCVSSYPSPPSDSNLAAIDTMRRAFGVPVGWSDHSLGLNVSLAAVARGACILERHFTLDRTLPGPDHAASLDPAELANLVQSVREVESAIGSGAKAPTGSERDTAEVARRSLHTARDIPSGTCLQAADLVLLRPGMGLPPSRFAVTVGRITRRAIGAGEMLVEEDLE